MNSITQPGASSPFAQAAGEGTNGTVSPRIRRKGALVEQRRLIWVWAGAAVLISALGLLPIWLRLWQIWTTDPLRSIGMLIVPAAVFLTLREWRMSGWETRGSWWGAVLLILSYLAEFESRHLLLYGRSTPYAINLLPHTLPLYLLGSGLILLFAGPRVWQRAWFPLALLLLAQPVPNAFVHWLDYPLQSFSARTARSFATLIGFAPRTPEPLRLMFTPNFGMFIAPGCDGIRGAVGLGYAALIAGYVKRLSWGRWLAYVFGAVLMGHLFNLLRLCALVLYYRIAVGHPALENFARMADYLIGGLLFLIAVILFLTAVLRSGNGQVAKMGEVTPGIFRSPVPGLIAVTLVGAVATVVAVKALQLDQHSLLTSLRSGQLHPQDLDNLLPRQFGDYALERAWQEEMDGSIVMESGIYRSRTSDEVTLGIWLGHINHSAHDSWMVRGEIPEMRAVRTYPTSEGRAVAFDTAYYSDGFSDRFRGTADCTPSECRMNLSFDNSLAVALSQNADFTTSQARAVPFFFSVERPHGSAPKETVVPQLSREAQEFLSAVDFKELSRRFQ